MTDAALRAYLLGRATDADAARLEAQLLEDEQLVGTLQSLEDDLFDEYARNTLSADDARRFLERYGDQKERLTFARALAARTSRTRSVRWGWLPLALAATLVLAAGGYLLIPTSTPAPSGVVARQAQTPVTPPPVFALVSLGGSRADSGAPVITVPKEADAIQVRVRLNPADRFDRYVMELRSASNAVVWRADDRQASAEAGDMLIEGTVPAVSVREGSYELAVSGLTGASAPEPLGFVQVRIARTP